MIERNCIACDKKVVKSAKDGWIFKTFSICNECRDKMFKVGTNE